MNGTQCTGMPSIANLDYEESMVRIKSELETLRWNTTTNDGHSYPRFWRKPVSTSSSIPLS